MAIRFVSATVNVNGLLAALVGLKKLDVAKALKELRRPMHADQKDHRDHEQGPRARWQPLASTTKASYARRGLRRNRRLLARLPNARTAQIKQDTLYMRSRVKWSLAHQDGPTRVGRGSIIPNRQFLWISRGFMKETQRVFKRALWIAFKRKLGIP